MQVTCMDMKIIEPHYNIHAGTCRSSSSWRAFLFLCLNLSSAALYCPSNTSNWPTSSPVTIKYGGRYAIQVLQIQVYMYMYRPSLDVEVFINIINVECTYLGKLCTRWSQKSLNAHLAMDFK